ncbi:hypothetical protein JGI7_00414 [Candidatus Kryptonium thompsonii]|uniref:Uncharacterized protein n=3 Tax=Candidatus Kryptonium thompsonii TaxID=1633631 RepID=A0A0P1MS94_9BACT|nr:DUF4175 family protein [Candidatus Kryptonium thompsoni]CUS78915.1 hypothetical protein JGI8_00260 [Candidatus Kryptonium thompsoni]CUS80514.1 hypothetical protein JGI7_00414 [Candidatus Kryptonium thompsoni]CUS98564.1 hypothetical protein JGI11_00342 [Candidatus Kryptonium thompsoni]CUU03723.1 hypothetical protein JGI4_00825 [Candidatus Kryptonium thompsoni]
MNEIYLQIKSKLERLRKSLDREELKTRFSRWFVSVILFLILIGLFESEFYFASPVRKLIFYIAISIFALSFCVHVLPSILKLVGLLKSKSDIELAKLVWAKHPEVRDKLVDALQIYEQKSKSKNLYSEELIDSAFAQLASEVLKFEWSEIDKSESNRKILSSLLIFGVFILSLVLLPEFRSSFVRILNYDKKFLKPEDYTIKIEPGNATVEKGANVKIKIQTIPQKSNLPIPGEVELYLSQEGMKNFEIKRIKSDRSHAGEFEHEIYNVRTPFEYFVKVKDLKTEKFKIDVIDKPIVKLLKVQLLYPSYTGFSPVYLEDNMGDITAIAGTIAKFEILSNKSLDSAKLVFNNGLTSALDVNETMAKGNVKLMQSGTYHIELKSKDGLKNEQPVEYKINIIQDEYPKVQILRPEKSIDISRDMQVGILAKISDDFGFTKMRLAYKLNFSRYVKPWDEFKFIEIAINKNSKEQEVPYLWDLSELDLAPDDVLSYYLEVFDNDFVSGPKSARTELYTIRFPSLHEILAQVEQSQNEIYQDVKDVFEMAKKLRKEMDEIEKDLKKGNLKLDWQRQQQIQNIAKQYQELQNKIKETTQKLQNLVQKMEENRLLSPETLEKYLELQKLLNQLDIPELKELMKRFEEAMQNLNPDLIRQALEKFQFSEENFRRSIERTINLLKRIQVEQKLNEILKQTEQVLEKQEELRKKTAQANPENKSQLKQLSDEQRELKEEVEKIEENLENLKERMGEFKNEMPLDSLEKILNEIKEKKFGQKFDKAGEKIMSGNLKEAGQIQFELSEGLMQMQSGLQSLQQQLMQNQQRQIISKMQKIQKDLLTLSKEQEEIKRETQNSSPGSSKLHDLAREQMDLLSGLNSVASELIELSQKTFAITPDMGREIGSALMNMHRAIESLSTRDNANSSKFQTEAMNSLNKAIIQLGNAMQAMMQGGAGGGLQFLLQQLNQLAMQQLGLNQATQELMQQLSLQQQAEMARLAAQQELIRKSLQELMKEAELSGNKGRILGDMNKIAEEMKEVISDLESGNLNEETIRKQDRILSRLLDAQRSIHERDFEKQRESRPGQNITRQSPAELKFEEEKEKIFQDLLKSIRENYHKDYEALIKKYFELLRSIQQ